MKHARTMALSLASIAWFAGPAQPQSPYLDQPVATRSRGLPGALTASDDGQLLFLNEGGDVLVFDHGPTGTGMSGVHDREPIGDLVGAQAAELEWVDDGESDLLLIAAGHNGLWAMGVAVGGFLPGSARIDDSESGPARTDLNRKWCCDVEVLEAASGQYALALFQERGLSQLRIYPLDAVRSIVTGGPETPPAAIIELGDRGAGSDPDDAVAMGLAVGPTQGTQIPVYVAMGQAGLVRVLFDEADPTAGPALLDWGPVFGDGSHYESVSPGISFFGDLTIGTAPGERILAPAFAHAAVHDGVLYVAVDHMGLVTFDLADAWGPQMPVGFYFDEPLAGDYDSVLPNDWESLQWKPHLPNVTGAWDGRFLYPRRLQVVELDSGIDVLAVACGPHPVVLAHNLVVGERSSDYTASVYSGIRNGEWQAIGQDWGTLTGYTLLYDLSQGLDRPANFVMNGGASAVVRPDPVDPEGDQVIVYAGHNSTRHPEFNWETEGATVRAVVDMTTPIDPPKPTDYRWRADRPAMYSFSIGYSVLRPNLLLFGSQESGYPTDGFLALCGDVFDQHVSLAPKDNPHTGLGVNFRAQWHSAHDAPDRHKVWSTTGGIPWRLTQFEANDQCVGMNPRKTAEWKLKPPPDPLNDAGFTYKFAERSDAYDSDLAPMGAPPVIAVGCSGRRDGMFLLDRDSVELVLEPDEMMGKGDPPLELPNSALLATLETHPEFGNVVESDPDFDTGGPYQGGFLAANGLTSSTWTTIPRLFPMVDALDAKHWILAVPCWFLSAPPKLPGVWGGSMGDTHPEWTPDWVYRINHTHHLVRFFDVTDPTNPVYLAEVIGPDPESAALQAEYAELDGRGYVFVNDWAGRIYVYEVTDLLATAPQVQWRYTWKAPEGVSDSYRDYLRNIEVDTDDDGNVTVYACTQRHGVSVLKFDPTVTDWLEEVSVLESAGSPFWLSVRRVAGYATRLFVQDSHGGVRVYGEE